MEHTQVGWSTFSCLLKGNQFSCEVFPKFTIGPLNRLLAAVRKIYMLATMKSTQQTGFKRPSILWRLGRRLTQPTFISLAHIFMDAAWSFSKSQTGLSKCSTSTSSRMTDHHAIKAAANTLTSGAETRTNASSREDRVLSSNPGRRTNWQSIFSIDIDVVSPLWIDVARYDTCFSSKIIGYL